ncbi:transposase [Burkholderia metallica]|uniref:transposase n=1 Tax=Burkholderia metallica TaxID=488729 RepID=UPI00157A2742
MADAQDPEAIFCVLRCGCAWRNLPKDFLPATTVHGWILCFRRKGTAVAAVVPEPIATIRFPP